MMTGLKNREITDYRFSNLPKSVMSPFLMSPFLMSEK